MSIREKRGRRPDRLLSAGLALVFVSAGGEALAAAARSCPAVQLRAAAKSVGTELLCEAGAAARGGPVDTACVGRTASRFTAAFDKARMRGGCATTTAATVEQRIDAFITDVANSMPAGSTRPSRKCAAAKLRATGRYAANELRCHAVAVATGGSPMECLDRAETKFRKAFTRPEAKGGCAPGGSIDTVDPKVDAFADEVVGALSTGASMAPEAVSFSADVQPIFTQSCALPACHTGPTPVQGQNLSAGNAYASLVGVPSVECAGFERVAPGAPDRSYLVFKLMGAGLCFSGAQMPFGGAPLPPAKVATIVRWITEGAPNN